MKTLFVPKIACSMEEAFAVPDTMDSYGLEFETIENINWPENYPYRPEVKFRIAHTGIGILLHFQVTEESVRAVAGEDGGRVWEDSCVEFFLSPEGNDHYYNFECNCIGNLWLHGGEKDTERIEASEDVFRSIKRWSSLGMTPFEEQVGERTWEVALTIPVSALFNHSIMNLSGKLMRANFYKCGDLLQTPHFLSWNPIDLPEPNFHCPEFFGKLDFE